MVYKCNSHFIATPNGGDLAVVDDARQKTTDVVDLARYLSPIKRFRYPGWP
jgi:hypothetical protein